MFIGWYYNGQWNNCPSKEQQAKLDALLIPMGAKKIKEIDPKVNYVELFNNKAG